MVCGIPSRKSAVSQVRVDAGEVVSAVSQRGEGRLIQPVADHVDSELHEVRPTGPTEVVDQLQPSARVVEIRVLHLEVRYGIDAEDWRRMDAGRGDPLDAPFLDQVTADHVVGVAAPVVRGAGSEFIQNRWGEGVSPGSDGAMAIAALRVVTDGRGVIDAIQGIHRQLTRTKITSRELRL